MIESDTSAARIPVNVLTGFLGSGKTSLIRRLVATPTLARAAVLINEFGEVGLDHLLVERIDEGVVLLQSGCICCTIRDDLGRALKDLHERRLAGEIPDFDRVVIETTGLADPAPVIATLVADPVIHYHFRMATLLATLDAVNADQHLDSAPEACRQIAMADRVIITKTDLVPAEQLKKVESLARRLNPGVPLIQSRGGDPEDKYNAGSADGAIHETSLFLFAEDAFSPGNWAEEMTSWAASEGFDVSDGDGHGHQHHGTHSHDVNRHGAIRSICLQIPQPLDWVTFGVWLSMLLHCHGDRILRVKGVLNVVGATTPVVVHGVQHLIHPPRHMDAWPTNERISQLVFIVKEVNLRALKQSFRAFVARDVF